MQNVLLLSEVHPLHVRYAFDPFDPLQQMIVKTGLESSEGIKRKIFLSRIKVAQLLAAKRGNDLILRDHTHSDYFLSPSNMHPPNKLSLRNCLKDQFDIYSVLTVRNPVDSYASLCANNWNYGKLNIDEYASQVLLMIRQYDDCGIPVYRYEDFCADPEGTIVSICEKLEIVYNPRFLESYQSHSMTGDSGRARNFATIKPIPRREMDPELVDRATQSRSVKAVAARLGYDLPSANLLRTP
jgi:hypothetical protein